ncbi:triglyceride lipase [Malassezia pachydermatis]|uniref:triacylglycerol lipase n=1 Tax=Malassezia pachydermatis TaxID=77020 RepID=A0A0M8MQR0_9BASI|nr:putative secretory lipase (family lip) [Malassezia pachydermatis]KOS12404.1 putative secretory lipase (family lip) [Malassezia pachydermatis]
MIGKARLWCALLAFLTLPTLVASLAFPRRALPSPASPATAVPGLTPDKDSFYNPPPGWQHKKPGDILAWREIKPKFLFTDFKVEKAYQVMYRTSQNTADEPQYTVTTILVPFNAKKDKLMVGSEAVDACGVQCTPSYGYLGGAITQDSGGFQLDEAEFLPFLRKGYIMTVPDKEGPLLAFAAGRMEGYMTLDSARATINFEPLGLSKDTKIGMYGYSGGALTLGWAAGLHPVYAPELNIVGMTFGGTPANLSGTIEYASGTTFAGFIVAGITGIINAYPKAKKYVDSVLLPKGREAIEYAQNNCWVQVILKYMNADINDEGWTTKGAAVFRDPIVQEIFDESIMGAKKEETPTAPLFIYHAEHDEIIPVRDIEKTVDAWCANGANIKYTNYNNGILDHETLEVLGIGKAVQFIDAQMDGNSLAPGCQKTTSNSVAFEPGVLGSDLEDVMNLIWTVFGQTVGPKGRVLKQKAAAGHDS